MREKDLKREGEGGREFCRFSVTKNVFLREKLSFYARAVFLMKKSFCGKKFVEKKSFYEPVKM